MGENPRMGWRTHLDHSLVRSSAQGRRELWGLPTSRHSPLSKPRSELGYHFYPQTEKTEAQRTTRMS